MQGICYWCGKTAVSMEHVPPKCIFPEDKDIKDFYKDSYRKNLIKVPSCDLHNIEKSSLDEYLMATLTSKVGNNWLAFIQTKTKLNRTLSRNKNLLNVKHSKMIDLGNNMFPVSIIEIDNKKLAYAFEAIARGLYFYENNKPYKGEIRVVSEIFNNEDYKEAMDFTNKTINLIEKEAVDWGTKVLGENPKIFTYQFSPVDGFNCQTLKLCFFEGIKVYVILNGMSEENRLKYQKSFEFIRKNCIRLN
ncbi:hypothetical protein [Peribacillus sp. NPDC097295]|uniref:hypothetical protein n=1 Tax=Peribacillus sp. NPDC097295 TaxID=3364402 RepID=UPI00382B3558